MRAWILFLGCLLGCGGAVSSPVEDGGGTDGGGGGADGGGCGTTPPNCFCGSPKCTNGQWACPRDCGDPCTQLRAQIETARKMLVSCCPTCKSVQCQGVAQDVCCEITTNGGDPSAFDALVKKYKYTCMPACPGIPCLPVPSGICDPDQGSQTMGHCR